MPRTRESPRILIIAGPNGAGKTTFATEYLNAEGQCPRFVNADLIASGLNPFDPAAAAFQASRLMIESIRELTKRGESFAFETTLSGLIFRRWISLWRELGYRVVIHFLYLRTPTLAINRVADRVRGGGHHVPDDVIKRRYEKGLSNFEGMYRVAVDEWTVYDTSGSIPLIRAGSSEISARDETVLGKESERAHEVNGAIAAMCRAASVAHRRTAARDEKISIWQEGEVVWIDPIMVL